MLSETLKALVAAGATPEQLLAVVQVHEKIEAEKQQELREKWRTQKKRQRMMSTDVHQCPPDIKGQSRIPADLSLPLMVSPPSLYSNISTPPSLNPLSLNSSFAEFWLAYPRKVGKGTALKAYAKALKKTQPETILAAVKVYPWPADKEFVPHPSTWLNGERWADETQSNAKPSVETFRIGHPKGVVKFEPEPPKLTPEELEERARRIDDILKGVRKPVEVLSET